MRTRRATHPEGRHLRWRLSVALLLVALLLALLFAAGCGSAPVGSGTTTSTYPAALSRYAPLLERLRTEGVPVVGAQEIQAGPWGGRDSGVTVLLQSTSTGEVSEGNDAVNSQLVVRAAALEKTAGMNIQAIGYRFVNASGKLMGPGESDVRVDATIDPSWYEPSGLPPQQVEQTIQAQFNTEFGSGPFVVTDVHVATDPDGTRVLTVALGVPSVTEANQTIDKVMLWVGSTVDSLNHDQKARLGVSHIVVKTTAGQTVVDWMDDLELGSSTGSWAPGITNYWFPSPAPAPSVQP